LHLGPWEYERKDGRRDEKNPCCSPLWRATELETKALTKGKGNKKGWQENSPSP